MSFPYRLFDITLLRRTPLSPSLCRFTFGGGDVRAMRTFAPDQRVKLFFPNAIGNPSALTRDKWLEDYQAMPPEDRPLRRTYTIRALRAGAGEVDIEFVLHGSTGPASRWALTATPGDRLQIVAPHEEADGDPGGYEWRPPVSLNHLLLLADETALPAVTGILEELAARPSPPETQAFIEIPLAGDRLPLPTWPSLKVNWAVRAETMRGAGEALVDAARDAQLPDMTNPTAAANELPDIDVDRAILWETQAAPADGRFYAWVAGEAGAVKAIRQILLKERGLPRSMTNLMGYWRRGQVLE